MNVLTALLTATCLLGATAANGAETRIRTVKKVPAEAPNKHYPSNRPPLATSPLVKLPVGAVVPKGWLRAELQLQTDGFIGHLTEISPWCKAENNAWLNPDGKGHSGWEELPYWLKGFGDTGYVLDNKRIIAEAQKWIEGIIASRQEWTHFVATVGLDDSQRSDPRASIICHVIAEDAAGKRRTLAESPTLKSRGAEEHHFNVQLPGDCAKLHLVVEDAGDGINCDHAD